MKNLWVLLLMMMPAYAQPSHGSCAGTLAQDQGEYIINEDYSHERICTFDETGGIAVSAICSIGHHCKVTGLIDFCKDSGECDHLSHVTSVQSDGRGRPARLTGAGCETEKECPWK